MTAGVLTTGTTLAVEWPVTGSVADAVAGTTSSAEAQWASTTTTVDDGDREPARSVDGGERSPDSSAAPATPGAGGRSDVLTGRAGDPTTVSRSGERVGGSAREPAWLAGCAGEGDLDSYENGTLPDDELCALPGAGHHLRPSAARAWWRLDEAYRREFGTSMCVTDSYRSLEQQQSLAAAKPGLAAQPGTSNHGWGSALDLCGGVESFGTTQHEWLVGRASAWGWENPTWAQADGSKPEPWHWEYVGRG